MWNTIKSMGMGTRIILLTMAVLLPVVVVNYVIFVHGYQQSAEKAMVEKAAAFTAVADEAKNHIGTLNKSNVFDTEELIGELKKTIAAGKPYTDARIFGTIPVVAGWTAAREAANASRPTWSRWTSRCPRWTGSPPCSASCAITPRRS